jgi:protein-ribulosamine 3-kinase
MALWATIEEHISREIGAPFRMADRRTVGGGCINAAYTIQGGGRQYFVKTNAASGLEMFSAEAEGLAEIARAHAIRVPQPICFGADDGHAFLVLEHIAMGDGGRSAEEALGRQLAAMHQTTRPRFGWHRDNTIGSTPQINTETASWAEFWREYRLGFQLRLAARGGAAQTLIAKGEQLMERVEAFFPGGEPVASLLHGDLWGGNAAVDMQGNPVIFDPAVYYGDREADIAMTELFGGFPQRFYGAYQEMLPLDSGYGVRKTLYNLYHILNHFNLFGGGYAAQAERMVERLLGEIQG